MDNQYKLLTVLKSLTDAVEQARQRALRGAKKADLAHTYQDFLVYTKRLDNAFNQAREYQLDEVSTSELWHAANQVMNGLGADEMDIQAGTYKSGQYSPMAEAL